MEIVILDDYEAVSREAADRISRCVQAKSNASIVLATGSSPMGAYQELGRRRIAGTFDASELRVFQLDGYLGLVPDDRRSLYRWLAESFLHPLGVDPTNVVRLPG